MWRTHISHFFGNVDWPTLVAGALVTLGCAALSCLMRAFYGRYASSRGVVYKIWGSWFSAEFDPKTTGQSTEEQTHAEGHNTFLRVRVKRRLGKGVIIKAVGPVAEQPQTVPTKWIVRGQIAHGDTLVGTWRSTVPNTKRHGTAILKFLDQGRAVGYWTGIAGNGHPVYGYWIMARDLEEVRKLADEVLARTQFKIVDVASLVARHPPPAASATR